MADEKGYGIQIEGLDEMIKAFDESPEKVGKVLQDTTIEAGKQIQREAVKEAPHAFGNLQKSIHMEYSPIQVEVSARAEYASFVEMGTKPHSINPQVLEKWAAKTGANPYAVARSIRVRGTKANPFMQRTKDKLTESIQEMFVKASEIIKNLLSK